MAYPKFKNKHLQEALFHPVDWMNYMKLTNRFPKKYVLTYQKSAEDYFVRKYKPRKKEVYSLLTIFLHKDIGFVRMTGIGAPNAVAIIEEIIALGGKEFINIGTAGGLHNEGVFLCEKALRDEGTSHHYLKDGKFIYPDGKLTDKLGKALEVNKIEYKRGATWTIDAPYRETKKEVEHYSKQGISTVEMEASALFAVAKYRKVKIASAFVVSDLLGKKWTPKFHRFNVKKEQRRLIDAAVACLKGD